MARLIDRVLWPLVATPEGYLVTLVIAAFAPSMLIWVPVWPSPTWVYMMYGCASWFLQAVCGVSVIRSRRRFEDWTAVQATRDAERRHARVMVDRLVQRDLARSHDRLLAQTAELVKEDQDLDPLPPWPG